MSVSNFDLDFMVATSAYHEAGHAVIGVIAKLQQRFSDLKKDHHATLRITRQLQRWVNAKARAA